MKIGVGKTYTDNRGNSVRIIEGAIKGAPRFHFLGLVSRFGHEETVYLDQEGVSPGGSIRLLPPKEKYVKLGDVTAALHKCGFYDEGIVYKEILTLPTREIEEE